jgi:ferric-dicitrate binding protein FerR (iron transport regulator)
MSHSEDRHLDFVLKHYKEGAFDTQKAIERFKDANGIRPTRRRSSLFYAVSAAAAILLGAFLFYSHQSRQWTEIYADDIQKTVVLPDNSCVTLAPGSNMSYRMKDSREVRMEGKIYFEVARDESRPFEVNADGAFVKVLGTEFMLDASKKTMKEVYVTEGKVLFAKDKSAEGVVLTDGMDATLSEGHEMPVINQTSDINAIAWKRGSFIFEDTPLKEVLECLSRHYNVSFAATDLSKRLNGEFHTDDLDLILDLIESALDVTIVNNTRSACERN